MAKERRMLTFDKTELSVVDLSGKNPVRHNLTYDKIISIQIEHSEKKVFFFMKKPCDVILINRRGSDKLIPVYSLNDPFFEEYLEGIRKFAKENRVSIYDYIANPDKK